MGLRLIPVQGLRISCSWSSFCSVFILAIKIWISNFAEYQILGKEHNEEQILGNSWKGTKWTSLFRTHSVSFMWNDLPFSSMSITRYYKMPFDTCYLLLITLIQNNTIQRPCGNTLQPSLQRWNVKELSSFALSKKTTLLTVLPLLTRAVQVNNEMSFQMSVGIVQQHLFIKDSDSVSSKDLLRNKLKGQIVICTHLIICGTTAASHCDKDYVRYWKHRGTVSSESRAPCIKQVVVSMLEQTSPILLTDYWLCWSEAIERRKIEYGQFTGMLLKSHDCQSGLWGVPLSCWKMVSWCGKKILVKGCRGSARMFT